MAARRKINERIQASILLSGRRRCCVCFSLSGDDSIKRGQIAHVDGDRSNSAEDNLVFLCLFHHDEFDSKTGQSKNLSKAEIQQFRSELTEFVRATLPPRPTERVVKQASTEPKTDPQSPAAVKAWIEHPATITVLGEPSPNIGPVSSHGRWKLRFEFEFTNTTIAGVFSGNDVLLIGKMGRHHKYTYADNNIKLDLFVEDADRPPQTWIAAWASYSMYGHDDGEIHVYETRFIDDDVKVLGPEILEGHKSKPIYGTRDVNSERFLTIDDTGAVLVWNWTTRTVTHRMNSILDAPTIGAFSVSAQDSVDAKIVVNDQNGHFEVFDITTERSLGRGKLNIRGRGAHVSFSGDNKYLIGSDDAERWDVVDSASFIKVDESTWWTILVGNHASASRRDILCKSASGMAYVISKEGDTEDLGMVDIFPPFGQRVSSMRLSDDGRLVAIIVDRKSLKIWEKLE